MAPWWPLLVAALLLSPERICYVWIARYPQAFRRVCRTPAVAWIGDPIVVVAVLFGFFKIVQFLVFLWWLYLHAPGGIWPPIPAPPCSRRPGSSPWSARFSTSACSTGWARSACSSATDSGTWCRGEATSRCPGWRTKYVGTVLTIWGGFLIARFPNPDRYLLPLVETVFYAVGAHLESGRPARQMDVLGEGSRAPADRAGRPARP